MQFSLDALLDFMDIKVRNVLFLFDTLIIFPWSEAHRYHVGGKGGWIINPHIRYDHWSDRTRFVVHDTLVFKYKKGEDSVLLATKDDYYNCNTESPIERWDDGATEVALNRSDAFFFLSGEEEHCRKGQRMIVVVLPWSPQPPIFLPPQPPVSEPPHASPAPGAVAPISPPPTTATPVRPPIQSPAPTGPASPKHAPTPASTPTSPPAPPTTSAPSPTVSAQTPSPIPTPTKAPAPDSTISPSPSAVSPTTTAPVPAPAGSSASAITGHHALRVTVVTILLSAIFS